MSIGHVVEQPDLLAADAEWRRTLAEIVNGLTKNMPGIRYLLNISTGNDDDAENQWAAAQELMETLNTLRERQEAAVLALEHSRGLWNTAIRSRNGELADLDAQSDRLNERIQELEGTAGGMEERHREAERQLASLAHQQAVAEDTLNRTRANEGLIVQDRLMEQQRLDEREARHRETVNDHETAERARTQDLSRRERALLTREAELTTRGGQLDTRSQNLHARETAVDELRLTVQQDQNRTDAAGQNLQRALSILHNLVNAAVVEFDAMPTLENIQDLAASVQTRCTTLQDTISEQDRSLTTRQEQLAGVTGQLETTTQQLTTTNNRLQETITRHNKVVIRYRDLLARTDETREARARDQEQIHDLQSNTIPRLEAAEQGLRLEVENLNEDNRRLSAETDRFQVREANLEAEMALLKENLSNEMESRRRLEHDKQQRQAMAFELNGLRRDKTELTEELTTVKKSLDKRVTECQSLNVATENDKARITELESLCDEKASQIRGRDSHVRDLEESRRSLESEIQAKASDVLALKERQQSLESDVEARDSQIQLLKDGNLSLEVEVKERDSEILSLKEGHRSLESKVEGRDSRILALEQDRQTLETRSRKELNELHRELTARQATIDSLTTALVVEQAASQQLKQQTGTADALHKQLRASEAKCHKATERSNEMSRENEKLKSLARSLESDLRNAESEAVDQDQQASDAQLYLRRQIRDLETEKSKLLDENQAQRSELAEDKVTIGIQHNEVRRLTAQAESCHRSDQRPLKRHFDQVDDEEEEAPSPVIAHLARRLEKAPRSALRTTPVESGPSRDTHPLDEAPRPRSSAPTEQGATAETSSRDQQSLVLRPGTPWRIEDVLNEQSTAHPIPQAILTELRSRIRYWDATRANWRAGTIDRMPKCAAMYALKRGTKWLDGDSSRACSYCAGRNQVCVSVVNHHIEILPAKADSGLDVADTRYWFGS